MSISLRKLAVAVTLGAFAAGGVAFAQETLPATAQEAAVEEEAVEEAEEAPAQESVAELVAETAPVPAPAVEAAPAQAAAPAPAKAETKVDFYGKVQYRLRDRLHWISDASDNTGSTNDYQNLFSWQAGLKAKVNDQLSLQVQIGNDWGAGEAVNWINNNTPSGRGPSFQNLYVHIASFKWNPGVVFVEGGVIALPSNGTLDLLERSLNLGHYGEAGFQGWSTEVNSSLLGLKLGIPILKDDFKLGLEIFQTVIDQRAQSLAAKDNLGNPSSPMFVVTLPIEAAGLKLTPEVTAILNRNYNTTTESGDAEVLFGAAAGYAVNKEISVSLFGGYGSVSNENSKVGGYSTNVRYGAISADSADGIQSYTSNGVIIGVGTAIKAGPGTIQFDFKYNNAVNTENEDNTKYDYFYTDLRYAYKANDKFTITPRYRNYYRTFPPNNANASRMENRLELILEGSF